MNLKKVLCLVVAVVLVAAVAVLSVNGNDLKAQLEAANVQIAEKETAAADLQAQLDAANVQITEKETAAADLQAQLDAANARVAELEGTDEVTAALQADLEAANAKVAELEAKIAEVYMPVYETQIAATYGEDGIIWVEDAAAKFEEMATMYQNYGFPITGMEDMVKESVLDTMVQEAVLLDKIEELGFTMSEEEDAAMAAEAQAMYEYYVNAYTTYFAQEGLTEEEIRANTQAYMDANGMSMEYMKESLKANLEAQKLYEHVVGDITISDEEVQAAYEAKVADQIEDYADNDSYYNNDRNNGDIIAWNPEGYRAVKQALVKFSDEQSALYSELNTTLTSLNDELAALDAPAEEAAEGEEPAEPRTREEIQADIDGINAEIEALYAEIMPEAEEIVKKFNEGVSFEEIMAEHNDDPGMTNEPTATIGYAVADKEGAWDPSFVAGAMSIEEVGQISAPIRGSYGIYVIYYMADITPGAVPFEEIAEEMKNEALQDKLADTYDAQVAAWIEEAAPVYHIDRF